MPRDSDFHSEDLKKEERKKFGSFINQGKNQINKACNYLQALIFGPSFVSLI
ncbi:hypothetical protein KJA13_02405 [Patescibacteria group bacterium]|nr:hypothetical protein [Patescibacteria group bacterium]